MSWLLAYKYNTNNTERTPVRKIVISGRCYNCSQPFYKDECIDKCQIIRAMNYDADNNLYWMKGRYEHASCPNGHPRRRVETDSDGNHRFVRAE